MTKSAGGPFLSKERHRRRKSEKAQHFRALITAFHFPLVLVTMSGTSSPATSDLDDNTVQPFETISDLLLTNDKTVKGDWAKLRRGLTSPGQTVLAQTTGEGIMPFATLNELIFQGNSTITEAGDTATSIEAMIAACLQSPEVAQLKPPQGAPGSIDNLGPLISSKPSTPATLGFSSRDDSSAANGAPPLLPPAKLPTKVDVLPQRRLSDAESDSSLRQSLSTTLSPNAADKKRAQPSSKGSMLPSLSSAVVGASPPSILKKGKQSPSSPAKKATLPPATRKKR